jgi:DNA-directed RNA polymerase specialized sigma24 family protein
MKIDDHDSSIDGQGPSASETVAGRATNSRPEEYAARMGAARTSVLDLWESEYNLVVRFVMRAGADFHAAEDATQTAFVDAWRQAERPEEWSKIDNPRA